MPSPPSSAGHPKSALKVPCPQCNQPSLLSADNVWRPFCSERCKMVDLGAWASERYTIEADDAAPETPDQRTQ